MTAAAIATTATVEAATTTRRSYRVAPTLNPGPRAAPSLRSSPIRRFAPTSTRLERPWLAQLPAAETRANSGSQPPSIP